MQLQIINNGFQFVDDNGIALVYHKDSLRRFVKMDDNGNIVETASYKVAYDSNHNYACIMRATGTMEQKVYDEYKNVVAEFSSYDDVGVVLHMKYKKSRHGRVAATVINTKRYHGYWSWYANIPVGAPDIEDYEETTDGTYITSSLWGHDYARMLDAAPITGCTLDSADARLAELRRYHARASDGTPLTAANNARPVIRCL